MRKYCFFTLTSLLLLILGSCRKTAKDPLKSLIDIQEFTSNATCSAGGLLVHTGIDRNRNNILDPSEIENSKPICNGQNGSNGQNGQDGQDGGVDKLTILPILRSDFDFYGTGLSEPSKPLGSLVKFSKLNYPGVDSITLITNAFVQTQGGSAIVQLFNVTDNAPIPGATVTSNNYAVWFDHLDMYSESKNFFSLLPEKEITLAVTLRAAESGQTTVISKAYLLLYRK